MAGKYKNIVGTGFDDYVQKQINDRVEITNKQTRDPKDLLWLSNRNAWFRLSSGANFNPSPKPDKISEERITASALNDGINQLDYTITTVSPNNEGFTDDLAKKYVLQGGTIQYTGTETDRDGNVTSRIKTKDKFSETYTKNQENIPGVDDLGFKPMPGITNVSVGTRGKWRTTLEADISIKAYNLEQLEIVNRLYMSLGVHVFLEWGHTPYIDNEGKVNTTPINPIDYFAYGNKGTNQGNNNDRVNLLREVEKKKKSTSGNYGGLVGRVSNFRYTANTDGSYDCNITVIGPGSMLESIKVNRASRFDFDKTTKEDESKKYGSDLENALTYIKNFLLKSELNETIVKKSFSTNLGTTGGVGSSNTTTTTTDNTFGSTNEIFTTKLVYDQSTNDKNAPKLSYGNVLNDIFSSCTYKGYEFSDSGISYPNDIAQYGNAWQYLTNIDGNDNDGLSPLPQSFFSGFVSKQSPGGQVNTEYNTTFGGDTLESVVEDYTYITFGHLLALIQHVCVFTENRGNVSIGSANSDNKGISPVVWIDFHPDNTIMKTGPLQASIDPRVCMVPFNVGLINTDNSTLLPLGALGKIFAPLETENPNRGGAYTNQEDTAKSTDELNLLRYNDDKISGVLNNIYGNDNGEYNKLMNVLVNIDFAISTLKEKENSDKSVDLLTFVNAILDGITIALGKINNFRAFFDDCSHALRIVDEHRTEPINQLVEIPNFGLKSLTYNYSFSSQISPKLAAQIVIASQGQNAGIRNFSEDVLTYQKLNGGIRDRFAGNIDPAIKPPQDPSKIDNTKKVLYNLFKHLYNIYALDNPTSPSNTNSLTNPYVDLLGKNMKYYPQKSATLLIPLTLDLEIDGLTGIMPYNAFLLPKNRLPIRYQDKGVAFIVFSIDHEFESNQWKTKLTGQMIFRGDTLILDDRKSGPTNTPKRTPVESLNVPTISTDYNPDIPTGNFDLTPRPLPGDKAVPEQETPTDPDPTPNISDDPTLSIIKFIEDNEGLVLVAYPDLIAAGQSGITADSGFVFKFEITNSGGTWDSKVEVNPGDRYRWVIGYGSNTITSLTGNVKFVKKGDTIDRNQAMLDLERRLKSEFIPKVKRACASNDIDYDQLPTKVKVVFVDCAYNYGTLWNSIAISFRDGGIQGLINELQRRIDRGSSQVPRRRAEEIKYLGGTPRI